MSEAAGQFLIALASADWDCTAWAIGSVLFNVFE